MNTNPELIDRVDVTARPAKKEWAEPQIVVERSLEARANDTDKPFMFPTPTGRRIDPLNASGL